LSPWHQNLHSGDRDLSPRRQYPHDGDQDLSPHPNEPKSLVGDPESPGIWNPAHYAKLSRVLSSLLPRFLLSWRHSGQSLAHRGKKKCSGQQWSRESTGEKLEEEK
jgi:hypothetical protein